MKDKRGSAIMLLGLLFIFSFFIFSLIILDFMALKTAMEKSKDAVTAACLAGLGEINREALGYNIMELDKEAAIDTFIAYLEDNFGDISAIPPVVQALDVYNREELPAVCTNGSTLNDPSIHTVVQVSLRRPVLSGICGKYYTFHIHLDCNNAFTGE